jgi:hypothetical protein
MLVPVSASWSGSLIDDSCVAISCIAVGLFEGTPVPPTSSGGQFTGIFSLNLWQRLNSPEAPASGIDAVACRGSQECMGVGGQQNRIYVAVLSHQQWHTLPSTMEPSENASLSDVTCSKTECVAVGSAASGSETHPSRTLALVVQATGSNRPIGQTIQLANSGDDYLSSVSCPANLRCIAVGYSQTVSAEGLGNARPLVLEERVDNKLDPGSRLIPDSDTH